MVTECKINGLRTEEKHPFELRCRTQRGGRNGLYNVVKRYLQAIQETVYGRACARGIVFLRLCLLRIVLMYLSAVQGYTSLNLRTRQGYGSCLYIPHKTVEG